MPPSQPTANHHSRAASLYATLLLAITVGTFTQLAFGVLAPFLVDDLSLSRTGLGAISTGLSVLGALFSYLARSLTDRFPPSTLLAGGFAIGLIAFLAIASAPSAPWLWPGIAAAALCGALANPVTNRLVGTYVSPGRQGVAIGVKQSGSQVGAVIAGLALPPLALTFGWRGAMLLPALLAAGGLAASRILRGMRTKLVSDDQTLARVPRGWVGNLAMYAFLMGMCVAALNVYLPLYAVESLGLTVTRAGMAAALVGVVGVVARIVWSWNVEKLANHQLPLGLIAALSAVSTLLLLAPLRGPFWLFWLGVIGMGCSAAAWNAVGMLVIVRQIPGAGTGRASAVVTATFYAGLASSPVAFGALVDHTRSYVGAWLGVATVSVLAVLMVVAWHRRERRTGQVTERCPR